MNGHPPALAVTYLPVTDSQCRPVEFVQFVALSETVW